MLIIATAFIVYTFISNLTYHFITLSKNTLLSLEKFDIMIHMEGPMKLSYVVKSSKYENIKQVLKEEFMVSDRLLLKLKSNQKIYQNGQIASVHSSVLQNDIIEVFLDLEEDNSNIVPVKMDISILYEDDSLLIVNKKSGIPIHPSGMHYEDSLSNGVAYYFYQIGLKKKIRPVNRLDKDTSRYCYFCQK